MASLLVVYQEGLRAATVLISEIIARALTIGMNGHTAVYEINSLLVVCQEGLHSTTPVSEIIAQAPTRRSIWTAATMAKSVEPSLRKAVFVKFCFYPD